jgi:hypothetical protein
MTSTRSPRAGGGFDAAGGSAYRLRAMLLPNVKNRTKIGERLAGPRGR